MELSLKICKSLLVIAPHPDDEINIAGQLIYKLKKTYSTNIDILFITNGDYYSNEKNVRLKESVSALSILGIQETSIHFLGYADGWKGKHIYDADPFETCKARDGREYTVALDGHAEIHKQRCGSHALMNKSNMLKDLEDFILDRVPDIIITTDYDNHPDHRATLLIVEEVLKTIVVKRNGYHPLLLTKFAYNGVWYGKDDYYTYDRTCLENTSELENPFLLWDERIEIPVDGACLTQKLKDNIVYKALKQYRIELADSRASRICNSDDIYWAYRTDNLALGATVNVSSGNGNYINDNKRFDTSSIMSAALFDRGFWKPDAIDQSPTISLKWDQEAYISFIDIYGLIDDDCNIVVESSKCKRSYMWKSAKRFRIDAFDQNTNEIKLKFSGAKDVRISEIECYSDYLKNNEGKVNYDTNRCVNIRPSSLYIKTEKAYINIRTLLYRFIRKLERLIK